MKRIKITPEMNVKNNIRFNENIGLKHQILREPSLVDDFYFEKCCPSDDSKESVAVVDPIIILFNQERIENMGATAAKAFLDSLTPKSNSLSELRSKCSDDDLISMLKSRHLQAPAEILAWARYMQSNMDEFNSEVAKVAAQQQAEETTVETDTKTE